MSEAPLYFENASHPEVNFALGMLPPKSVDAMRKKIHYATSSATASRAPAS